MIIGSNDQLEVGKRHGDSGGVYDGNMVKHANMPFVVLREATFEEWAEHARNQPTDLTPERIEAEIRMVQQSKDRLYFYEVSVD